MGGLWVLAVVAGHEMWTPTASAVHQSSRSETTAISIPLVEEATATANPYTQPEFDVYGNQIDEAVGDYRVDPRGDLFEQHSPDTALLKLGAPGA